MPVVVETRYGKLRGVETGGVSRFLNVPYAQPPLGALRFRPPEPPLAWEGERDASAMGPTAPQLPPPSMAEIPVDLETLVGVGWRRGDDFLGLGIWTPDPAAKDLPVMVFIHGGAFVSGGYHAPAIDGTAFARSGVVLVSINYRLGVEGFAPLGEGATNLGLRDQIAALEWVRDNIASFGGDPTCVTLFGESAGAMSIGCLIASPRAKGLFRRAIIQSGHGSMVRPVAVAARVTQKLAKLAGVTPDVAGFASLSPEEWLPHLKTMQAPTTRIDLRDERGHEPAYGLSRFLPLFGDDVLPERPLDALAEGAGSDVELLIGSNAEEMNLYFVPTGVQPKINRLLGWLLLRGKQRGAWRILSAYAHALAGRSAGEAFTAAMSDLVFRWPARMYAAAHRGRTHMYEFGWRSPAFGNKLGACHAIELPFVFDTLETLKGENGFVGPNPPQELADRTHGLWVRFAKGEGLDWPEYSAADPQLFRLEEGRAAPEPPAIAARYL